MNKFCFDFELFLKSFNELLRVIFSLNLRLLRYKNYFTQFVNKFRILSLSFFISFTHTRAALTTSGYNIIIIKINSEFLLFFILIIHFWFMVDYLSSCSCCFVLLCSLLRVKLLFSLQKNKKFNFFAFFVLAFRR